MHRHSLTLDSFHLVGIKVRTSNQAELNPLTAQIPTTVQNYLLDSISSYIPNRSAPGVTYCVYTEYEGDSMGPYTYFVGERVDALPSDPLPYELSILTIPAQSYVKFTTPPGPMPHVCIKAWQDIWLMGHQGLGAARAYQADFEVYDERALDLTQAVLDIYIGVKDTRESSASSLHDLEL